jgi:hypothetical protein
MPRAVTSGYRPYFLTAMINTTLSTACNVRQMQVAIKSTDGHPNSKNVAIVTIKIAIVDTASTAVNTTTSSLTTQENMGARYSSSRCPNQAPP